MMPRKSLCVFTFCILLFGSAFGASNPPRKYVPGELIIKFKKDIGKVENNLTAQSAVERVGILSMKRMFPWKQYDPSFTLDEVGLGQMYLAHVSGTTDVEKLSNELKRDPSVEYATPNYIVKADSVVPNDPMYSQEQHLPQVKATQAWEVSQGDTSVIIAILDTGTDWDHPDLAANIWRNAGEIPDNGLDDDHNGFIDDSRGWDFVDGITDVWAGEDGMTPDNDPMDFNGHGTHVSGIASGVTNNGIGIASLAWKCKIMPVRIGYHGSDGNGWGTYEAMSQAFVYAADNGASVANLSFGTGEPILDAARYAYLHGVVVCNSAGNSASEAVSVLGAQSYALSVAAVASDDRKASYSSYHPLVDISAPGGDFSGAGGGFLSTFVDPSDFYGGQLYGRFQGTSMASPYVASLCALVKSVHPTWSPAQIMFQVTGTADNIDAVNPTYLGKLGYGRINAYRAVSEIPPPASPQLSYMSVVITEAGGGNGNGRLDPGETGNILIAIQNDWGDATNATVTLLASSPALNITNGTWNIGTIKGISDLNNSNINNTSTPLTVSIHPQAVPMVIPASLTLTADGGINLVYEFDISISPSVLFVDDHGGGGDGSDVQIQSSFTEALRTTGVAYAVWNHIANGTPPISILNNYAIVVWGCEWAFPSLDQNDRDTLEAYLDGGGRLFLSGQDIGWDMNAMPGSGENEYTRSGFQSKVWYEKYLHARYVSDDQSGTAASTHLSGVPGDSIGNGFSITVAEPGRSAANQYPDVIQALTNGVDVFRYDDDSSGAVRYSGLYKVVYFSFGGLESITNAATRDSVFSQVYSWFTQTSLSFTRLNDLEDSTSSSTVTAQVSSGIDPLSSVDLYWDTDGAFPFNVVPMTDLGGGLYRAAIPAQNATKDVDYFVLARTTAGALPINIRRFHVGIDHTPPTISGLTALQNSIRRSGPFDISVNATDNIAVDTSQVYVVYDIDGGSLDSAQIHPTIEPGVFSGSFTLGTPASSGSRVNYYVRAKDATIAQNEARLPASGFNSFLVGLELIDDFEQAKPIWDFGTSWGRTTGSKKYGLYSITDSPETNGVRVNTVPNTTNILSFTGLMDLSGYSKAKVYYWHANSGAGSDTVFIEQSLDNSNWTTQRIFRGSSPWVRDSVALSTGPGTENLRLRFRLKVGNHLPNYDGVWLDDIEVRTDAFITDVRDDWNPIIPSTFALHQNYPNPFNPSTRIQFDLPERGTVSLIVYNVLGQQVTSLLDQQSMDAGQHQIEFNASQLSSGVYFYRLASEKYTSVRKMLLVR